MQFSTLSCTSEPESKIDTLVDLWLWLATKLEVNSFLDPNLMEKIGGHEAIKTSDSHAMREE